MWCNETTSMKGYKPMSYQSINRFTLKVKHHDNTQFITIRRGDFIPEGIETAIAQINILLQHDPI